MRKIENFRDIDYFDERKISKIMHKFEVFKRMRCSWIVFFFLTISENICQLNAHILFYFFTKDYARISRTWNESFSLFSFLNRKCGMSLVTIIINGLFMRWSLTARLNVKKYHKYTLITNSHGTFILGMYKIFNCVGRLKLFVYVNCSYTFLLFRTKNCNKMQKKKALI